MDSGGVVGMYARTGDGANNVVQSGDEESGLSLETEGFVHDCLVVVDDIFHSESVIQHRESGS